MVGGEEEDFRVEEKEEPREDGSKEGEEEDFKRGEKEEDGSEEKTMRSLEGRRKMRREDGSNEGGG